MLASSCITPPCEQRRNEIRSSPTRTPPRSFRRNLRAKIVRVRATRFMPRAAEIPMQAYSTQGEVVLLPSSSHSERSTHGFHYNRKWYGLAGFVFAVCMWLAVAGAYQRWPFPPVSAEHALQRDRGAGGQSGEAPGSRSAAPVCPPH